MRHLGKNKIGNSLQNYRTSKGLSREELASILEVDISEYKLIEDGSRPVPYKTMKVIFNKLELSDFEC